MELPIKVLRERRHNEASEKYLDVIFSYVNGSKREGSVPIEYRRTGLFATTKLPYFSKPNSCFIISFI